MSEQAAPSPKPPPQQAGSASKQDSEALKKLRQRVKEINAQSEQNRLLKGGKSGGGGS